MKRTEPRRLSTDDRQNAVLLKDEQYYVDRGIIAPENLGPDLVDMGLWPLEADAVPEPEPQSSTYLHGADPSCKHHIIHANGGGIKCTKCAGWFCY